MTNKTIDWLNSNRFRAYPFVNDIGIVCNDSRIPDCVLLDCQIMDTRHGIGIPELIFTKITVENEATTVWFTYAGISSSYRINKHASPSSEDYLSGENSFIKLSGILPTGFPEQFVHISLTFSSHEYILDRAGEGTWEFNGKILSSKVLSVTASGVSGIRTNGSKHIQRAGTASGDVHLVDGYRTQPTIQNGKVIVRVGNHYGYDPCHYFEELEESSSEDRLSVCNDLMFFFCGQNAINSGNVVLQGGPGVNIVQGREYTAKKDIIDTYGKVGIREGESVPCIEVIATTDLLNIYRPSDTGSSSSEESGSDS